jgi:aminopeptidase N
MPLVMRTTIPLALLLACLANPACRSSRPAPPRAEFPDDIHSFAEPERVRVTHVELDLELDFEQRIAHGQVELALERPDAEAPLTLDTKELEIEAVRGADGSERRWTLVATDGKLGSALLVQLEPRDERVRIRYRTTPRSEAMQWLAPEQTAGGRQPFLFTQGQSILTRSWIPLQDSPGIRVTYRARVRCPPQLTALMSAERLGRGANGVFEFRMDRPIPPYLIALACGELEFRALSQRCGVWAEPGVVVRAQQELSDTEAMVAQAEQLYGPYRWGRYDVLILPPSFPFGGMENPTLTFATPTILAGDRSLVALVAHELAHSWSGNLVTNATWSDFWLNEGFTVYCENRIMEAIYGSERAATERVLEIGELEEELETLEPWQEVLRMDLAGRHPDEGFSNVPYTKGALFLTRLEQVFGRERWDAYLRGYFEGHAFRSITTADFLADLERELFASAPELAAEVDIARWTEQPGLPADAPRPETAALAAVDRELLALAAGSAPEALATAGWTTQQWLRFLRGLPADTSAEDMAGLDGRFGFTRSGNSEILCQWLELSIRHGYAPADPQLEQFLRDVGRRKFLKPLYTALQAADPGRARALYAANRDRYHSVSTGTLDGILGWSE